MHKYNLTFSRLDLSKSPKKKFKLHKRVGSITRSHGGGSRRRIRSPSSFSSLSSSSDGVKKLVRINKTVQDVPFKITPLKRRKPKISKSKSIFKMFKVIKPKQTPNPDLS